MSSRMHQLAVENEQIADEGRYRTPTGETAEIGSLLAKSRAGTVSYPADAVLAGGPRGPLRRRAEVTAEGSMQAARRLIEAGGEHVAVLNFASARNPGGGYLRGARAQEEHLCRSSLLYRCLLEAATTTRRTAPPPICGTATG